MTNEQFKKEVDLLWERTKSGELSGRQERFNVIEALTERYFLERFDTPPSGQLDRLSTLCLYEEITDPHPDKMAREESPIMSDTQAEEREEKNILVADIINGRDKMVGTRRTWYEDDNGVMREKRQKIYDYNTK